MRDKIWDERTSLCPKCERPVKDDHCEACAYWERLAAMADYELRACQNAQYMGGDHRELDG